VRGSPLRLLKRFQHLFGSRTYGDVFGKIRPANRPGGINQKLCRTRDVCAFGSCAAMQEVVMANDSRLRIGQEGVGIAKFLSLAPINFRRVHANRDDLNPARFKFREPLLKTP
jgi:hypothetical protein